MRRSQAAGVCGTAGEYGVLFQEQNAISESIACFVCSVVYELTQLLSVFPGKNKEAS
jgi:hypothetical protein